MKAECLVYFTCASNTYPLNNRINRASVGASQHGVIVVGISPPRSAQNVGSKIKGEIILMYDNNTNNIKTVSHLVPGCPDQLLMCNNIAAIARHCPQGGQIMGCPDPRSVLLQNMIVFALVT